MVQAAAKRAEELRREINTHNHSYYVLDDSTISDADFDRLLQELRNLESEFPDLLTPDSPTQRVGGAPPTGSPRSPTPRPCSAWATPSTARTWKIG
jgi:DNA ligase (NAD+)